MTLRGKTILPVGPWPGGVNLRDENRASMTVDPKQLRWCLNLDVLDSGILQSRLGCRKVLSTAPVYGGTGIDLIGSGVDGASRSLYAIVAKRLAGPTSTFYYTRDPETPATGFNLIATAQTGTFTDVVNYNNVFYFIQSVGGTGTGQSRTSLSAGGWTAQPTIPKGDQTFVVRDRMFVVDWVNSNIYWSKATDPLTWAAPDGGNVFVSPGDGDIITKAVFINNSIYIFKRNKTFLFTFNTDPSVDGQLVPLSTVRGAHDAIVYNNEIYLVNDQSVYKLVNNYFTDIATITNIYSAAGLDQLFDTKVRLFVEAGDRLIVGPINIVLPGSLFTHYCMNLKTGAWSTRRYDDPIIQPQSDVQKKFITWRDSQTSAGASTGNIYVSSTGILSYTRFKAWNIADIASNTLDVNSAEHTISPEYSMVTYEVIPEQSYGEWKRCHLVQGRWYLNLDAFTDNKARIDYRVGPDLYTAIQTVDIPLSSNFFTVEMEGKAIFNSFRFKSVAFAITKTSRDLGTVGAKNPDDASLIRIANLQVIASGNRQQVSEAVNA
jgi:hypothetical protein